MVYSSSGRRKLSEHFKLKTMIVVKYVKKTFASFLPEQHVHVVGTCSWKDVSGCGREFAHIVYLYITAIHREVFEATLASSTPKWIFCMKSSELNRKCIVLNSQQFFSETILAISDQNAHGSYLFLYMLYFFL